MATEEAAKVWKEELDKACWEVSCEAEELDPGQEAERGVVPPIEVQSLADWIDYLKLLQLAAGQQLVGVKIDEDGQVFIYDRAPDEEDEMDALADQRYEDAKDEALFEGG